MLRNLIHSPSFKWLIATSLVVFAFISIQKYNQGPERTWIEDTFESFQDTCREVKDKAQYEDCLRGAIELLAEEESGTMGEAKLEKDRNVFSQAVKDYDKNH